MDNDPHEKASQQGSLGQASQTNLCNRSQGTNEAQAYSMSDIMSDAFNLLYHHHLQARKGLAYRMHTLRKRSSEEQDTQRQEQHLTQNEPLVMEKWALPLLQHITDMRVTCKEEIARTDFRMPAARFVVTRARLKTRKRASPPQTSINVMCATAHITGDV